MNTAFRTTLAAAGAAAALLAAPAMAQVSLTEQQQIARFLADQGYSHVTVSELDRDVTVLAFRDGRTQSFAYHSGNGRLVRVGNLDDRGRSLADDRSGDGHEDHLGRDDGGYGGEAPGVGDPNKGDH